MITIEVALGIILAFVVMRSFKALIRFAATKRAKQAAVLVKYVRDHNIDLEAVPLNKRQEVADAAVAYAKRVSDGSAVISESMLDAVKKELTKLDQRQL